VKKLAATALATIVIASVAGAQGDVKTQLARVYAQLNDHIKNKRIGKAEKLFAQYGHPKFVYINPHGRRQTAKEMLAEMEASLGPQTKVTRSVSRLDKVEVKASTATVRAYSDYALQMPGPDGKTHTFTGVSRSIDQWLKTPGGWKLKEVKVVSETMTMDGKPIRM
jgi:hypothetical protein